MLKPMPLFGSAAPPTIANKSLAEFKCGKMVLKSDKMVHPDERRGILRVYRENGAVQFAWRERKAEKPEEVVAVVTSEMARWSKVEQCSTGRVYALRLKSSKKTHFYWLQEPSDESDSANEKKINEALKSKSAAAAAAGVGSALAGSAAGGSGAEMSNFMSQMGLTQEQLFDFIGMVGGGRGSESSGTTPSTTRGGPDSRSQSQLELTTLQSMLANFSKGSADGTSGPDASPSVQMSDMIDPKVILPILRSAEIQERMKPFLPEGTSLASNDELEESVQSPQFKASFNAFGLALASGQLAHLLEGFGLADDAIKAAREGNTRDFMNALSVNKAESSSDQIGGTTTSDETTTVVEGGEDDTTNERMEED